MIRDSILLETWFMSMDFIVPLENGETELKQASSLDVRNSIEPEDNYKISENGEVLITEDGREIPIIKTGDVKVGNKKQNARAQALVRETLRQLRGTSVIIKADDRKVYFVKQTEKEYSMSKTTMNLENKERSAKYSAANKIKTIVENAKNPTWKPDENNKHGESAQRGWTYYDVDFIVTEDGKNFEQAQGRLVIRMGVDGRDSVYDIDNIKIETISTSITSPSRQPLSTSSIAPEAEKSTATGSGNDIRKSLEVDTEGRELNDSKKEF